MGGRDQAVEVEGGRRRGRRLVQLVVLAGVVAGVLGLAPTTAGADLPLSPTPVFRGDECGAPVIKGSRLARPTEYWDCTFVDDFKVPTLDTTKWAVQTTAGSGYTLGGECQVNTPANISFDRGWVRGSAEVLKLTARREDSTLDCSSKKKTIQSDYTGATLMTHGKFTQAYGRFEVKAKLPDVAVPGAQFSFWLWRQDGNPVGEIDPMEWYSAFPNQGIPMLHGAQWPWTNQSCTFDPAVGPWHTYTLEWSPRSIKVLYDGVVCLENTAWGANQPAPFDTPMMIALTIGLDPTTASNAAALPSSWTTEIDYVKVWQ